MSDVVGDALKFWGTIALAFTAAAGFGVYKVAEHHAAEKREIQTVNILTTRADEALRNRSLQPITIGWFTKSADCGNIRPYGSDFVARDAAGNELQGRICSSPDHESVITVKQAPKP